MAGFTPPFYPIVYVRGFAPTGSSRDDTFHDLYYGYAETSVEPRPKSPQDASALDDRIALDLFEGQLLRFMKEFDYADASHDGLRLMQGNSEARQTPSPDPTRSLWISRFYDTDVITGRVRPITEHAQDLRRLIDETIPAGLKACGVDGAGYKVILIAHSMGGLVCRALLQNLYPESGVDPKTRVHRLVTIASPHGGIQFGIVPDFLQNFVVNTFNPGDAGLFYDLQMRSYLKLGDQEPINSLGTMGTALPDACSFPAARCFCLIGSNHGAYDAVWGQQRRITGNFSDGLVKQDKAFIEGAFTANVHRAHTSRDNGIVNSYQSFENIHRFLFGDTKVAISLQDLAVTDAASVGDKSYYNLEFRLAVRGAGAVFLHDRREDPCENSIRFPASEVPATQELHTLFLSSRKARPDDPRLHFMLSLRLVECQVQNGLLWDHEYPVRPIYSESLEIRVNSEQAKAYWEGAAAAPNLLQYRWLSGLDANAANSAAEPDGDVGSWQNALLREGHHFDIPLRKADTVLGTLRLAPSSWPDKKLTQD